VYSQHSPQEPPQPSSPQVWNRPHEAEQQSPSAQTPSFPQKSHCSPPTPHQKWLSPGLHAPPLVQQPEHVSEHGFATQLPPLQFSDDVHESHSSPPVPHLDDVFPVWHAPPLVQQPEQLPEQDAGALHLPPLHPSGQSTIFSSLAPHESNQYCESP